MGLPTTACPGNVKLQVGGNSHQTLHAGVAAGAWLMLP